MKSIIIHANDGSYVELQGAGWHIDDEGHLHIRGGDGSGNVASFHSAQWASVSFLTAHMA